MKSILFSNLLNIFLFYLVYSNANTDFERDLVILFYINFTFLAHLISKVGISSNTYLGFIWSMLYPKFKPKDEPGGEGEIKAVLALNKKEVDEMSKATIVQGIFILVATLLLLF